MSIKKYNNSYFSQFFEANDSDIEDLAYNLYYKVKYSGIMPSFVKRETDERVFLDITTTVFDILEDDLDFTFGKCLDSSKLSSLGVSTTSEVIDKNFTMSFELKPKSSSFDFSLFN